MGSKKKVKVKRGNVLLMVLIAALFFVGSLVLVNPSNLYVSPDETANAFFSNQFADHGDFLGGYFASIVGLEDRIHPRSTTIGEFYNLAPGSFLGLPFIYGVIALVLGGWVLWVLTPLVTIGAALAWRKLVEKFTTPAIGLLSFGLFLLHPAVWYYSARGLMHNVLFLDLLILCAWLWVCKPKRLGPWGDLLAGLALGLALMVRTSEAVWIFGVLIVAAWIWRRTLTWRRLRAGLLGLAIGLALLFGMNYSTYGHPLATGYTAQATAQTVDLEVGDSLNAFELLPFGFHPMNAWNHFSAYAVGMFWWLSVLSGIGLFILFSQKKHQRDLRWMIALAAAVSVWLVFLYGSWEIHDNPDPMQITMANSYVRYWLPLYLFATPMIAASIVWLSGFGRTKLAKGLLVAALCITVVGFNISAVFVQGQDGLLKMSSELQRSGEIQESVLEYVEQNAVVIVDRADKLFFPHRRVMYPLRDDATYEAMPIVLESLPLYYYGITFPQKDIDFLNESKLSDMGLAIELIETYDAESLYNIYRP
jgi:hypothetical protein